MTAMGVVLIFLLPLRLFEIANPDWRPLGWLHAFVAIGVTFALIYLAGGWRWVRHFSFPILFFLIAVPWVSPVEAPIVQGLMRGIAVLAAETVSLLGIPAQVQGNLIRIANGVVGMNEACSGVRSLQTSLMIGLLLGELTSLSFWRRFSLVAGAVTIALTANFIRAVFLVWIAATSELAAVDRWHDFAGYTIVATVFLGSIALAAALRHRKRVHTRNVEDQERSEENAPKAKLATATFPSLPPIPYLIFSLLSLFAIEAAAESWYRAHERNLVTRTSWEVEPPKNAAGFRELKIEEGVRQTLRFDTGLQVQWRSPDAGMPENSTTNYLFFFRWNPGSSSVVRARAHRPDICLPSVGWKQTADHGVKLYRVNDNIKLAARHVSFQQERGNAVVETFFVLQEDKIHPNEARSDLELAPGIQPDWSLRARFDVVRHGIRNLGQQVLEVVFVTDRPVDEQVAEARFAQLLQQIVVIKDTVK